MFLKMAHFHHNMSPPNIVGYPNKKSVDRIIDSKVTFNKYDIHMIRRDKSHIT